MIANIVNSSKPGSISPEITLTGTRCGTRVARASAAQRPACSTNIAGSIVSARPFFVSLPTSQKPSRFTAEVRVPRMSPASR